MGRDGLPAEGEAPVEVPPAVLLPVLDGLGELKGVQVDGGNVGAHDRSGLLGNAVQERLQPAVEALTWGAVRKEEDFATTALLARLEREVLNSHAGPRLPS